MRQAVFDTVRYFDLFDQAITATQVWRNLINGEKVLSLALVKQQLSALVEENKLGFKWGHYFLDGKENLVELRQQRHLIAQLKWKLTRRIAKYLQYAPFITMLAMSGSLAAGNTKESSDLDIFVISEKNRIWTARLGLLFISQLLGRRRKYWQGSAPDKICLNHYVTTSSLAINSEIRNIYTAVLYHWLVPLSGLEVFKDFSKANRAWQNKFILFPEVPLVKNRLQLNVLRNMSAIKFVIEKMLSEPLFSWTENVAEKIQRYFINQHSSANNLSSNGRIVLSNKELAFHPDTKVPGILNKFNQDIGQQQLL